MTDEETPADEARCTCTHHIRGQHYEYCAIRRAERGVAGDAPDEAPDEDHLPPRLAAH